MRDIDTILSLRELRLATFFDITNLINSLLGEGRAGTENLLDMLKNEEVFQAIVRKRDARLVSEITETIRNILSDENSIAILTKRLEDYESRFFAATLLGWFGSKAFNAVPPLIGIASGSSGATGAAKQAIVFIGNAQPAVMQALLNSVQVNNDDGEFSELCSLAIRIGCDGMPAFMDALQAAVASNNPDMREAAADVVVRIGLRNQQMTSLLDKLRNDDNANVRKAVQGMS